MTSIKRVGDARAEAEARFKLILDQCVKASEFNSMKLSCSPVLLKFVEATIPLKLPIRIWPRLVFIPFADHFITELKTRFNLTQVTATVVSVILLLLENAKRYSKQDY